MILQIILFISIIQASNGLFEDQVGKFDWRQQYIGKVVHLKFEKSDINTRRFLVSTDRHIIALIDARNSRILWRHLLEKDFRGSIDDMVVHSNKYVVIATGNGTYIRCYKISSGLLAWEKSYPAGNTRSQLLIKEEQLAIMTQHKLTVVNIANGALVNDHKLTLGSAPLLITSFDNKQISLFSRLDDGGYSFTSLTKQVSTPTVNKISSKHYTNLRCITISEDQVACITSSQLVSFQKSSFKEIQLKDHFASLSDIQISLASPRDSLFLLTSGSSSERTSILFQGKSGVFTMKKKFNYPLAVALTNQNDQQKLMCLQRSSEKIVEMKTLDLNSMSFDKDLVTYNFPEDRGIPEQMYIMNFISKTGYKSMRFIVVSQDHSLSSLNVKGNVLWSREEAIASAVNVQMIDLPLSELQAELNDFALDKDGILTLLRKRIVAQLTQVKTFLQHMKHRIVTSTPSRSNSNPDLEIVDNEASPDLPSLDPEDEYLTRDEFNLHKMIVVVTANGKLLGLDSVGGKAVWRNYISDFLPFTTKEQKKARIPLFIQRTTSHPNQPPQALILGIRKFTGETIIYTFNPITGEPLNGNNGITVLKAPLRILQVTMFSEMNEQFLKPVIFLDSNLKYHVFPPSNEALVKQSSKNLFMFTAEHQSMNGYAMIKDNKNDLKAKQIWNINLEDQQIIEVRMKHHLEKVHSQGVVLGDRSVLYKYLNPNLAAVVTSGEEDNSSTGSKQGFINVYLIDTVIGHFVYKCTHKKASGPVSIEHSEHWITYSYWSEKHRRTEISVLELYLGNDKSNDTSFSSMNSENIVNAPLVLKQGFIFPGHLTSISATLTEKGLTNKHLLISMATGGILELPKSMVDPRRPLVPTAEDKEEGIMPYQPELPSPFEAMINYNQSVFQVFGVRTCPAGLESTSLVFAFGLDIYFTRVIPSKMFDVLKEEFDYFFIATVLFAMMAISFITQQLASRKALNRAWK